MSQHQTAGGKDIRPAPLVALQSWKKTWQGPPDLNFASVTRGGICVADATGVCVGGEAKVEAGFGTSIGYLKTTNDPGTVPVYQCPGFGCQA